MLASRSANKAYFQHAANQASKSLDLSADGIIDLVCFTDAGIAALLVRRAGVYCSAIVDGLQVDDASSRVMREMCHGSEEVSVYETVRAREAVLVVGDGRRDVVWKLDQGQRRLVVPVGESERF